jgi:DMSO/TMAO reductase YedYZ molybdopterin-dependent catalytic subunit
VFGVARAVIGATPTSVRETLVSRAGTADKPLLLAGVVTVVVLAGAIVGLRARTSRLAGRTGTLLLALAALVLTARQPGTAVVPTSLVLMTSAVLGIAVLEMLLPGTTSRKTPAGVPRTETVSRRGFLLRAAGTLAATGAAYLGATRLVAARSVEALRAAVLLPRPQQPAPAIPAGADPPTPGRTALVTTNDRFYKIDTTVGGDPQVDPRNWNLDIGGLVSRPRQLTYADLLAMPQTEAWITIGCVGNPVGGPLVATARWQGVVLADVLRAAGPRSPATQVAMTSVDGYTGAFPLATALDGRQALIALGMNGEPLPIAHGFPARVIVPGLYGYESAVKWLSRIDLVDDTYRAFWVQRGYAKQATFRTQSRIDVPADGGTTRPTVDGNVQIAGMAWAPSRGINHVEISVDGGPWHTATLAPATLGPDTWRPWTWLWPATQGTHELRVRATDSTGTTQPGDPRGVLPDGATGWHTIAVAVP